MATFKANMKFILSQKTAKWAQRTLIGEWKADTEIMDSHPERITPGLNNYRGRIFLCIWEKCKAPSETV